MRVSCSLFSCAPVRQSRALLGSCLLLAVSALLAAPVSAVPPPAATDGETAAEEVSTGEAEAQPEHGQASAGESSRGLGTGPVARIAFGSCARHDRPQPIWDAIIENSPELMILLGDNIYADTTDMEEMAACYEQLAAKPGFQRLRESSCQIVATWDDHDFGKNDAGREFPAKDGAEKLFLDFWEFPDESPARSRPGVYSAYVVGPKGSRLQILLLDTRYFRSPLKRNSQYKSGGPAFHPDEDEDATILGEAQWKWLEEKLEEPADLRIIGSSIQVIPAEHRFEKWANFPKERERLLKLLGTASEGAVLILSGDRHLAELSEVQSGGVSVVEATSSSLNLPLGAKKEPNRHRIAGALFADANFGLLTIDWPTRKARITLHDVGGKKVREHVFSF